MRGSTGYRNLRDFVPHQMNNGDVPHYTVLFKSPIDSKRSSHNASKLPACSKPVSTPASPKDGSFWRTNNNGFFQTPSRMEQSVRVPNNTNNGITSQRNSVSPQILNLSHRNKGTRKYHLQMQLFNDHLLMDAPVKQRAPKEQSEEQQIYSPKQPRRNIRYVVQTRTNSRVVDESKTLKQDDAINRNSFKFHFVLGKGGFGKVWKVEFTKGRKLYAMKEMNKAKVLSKKSVHSVMNERILLSSISHPFIANIHFAFQDREHLYLVMDLLTGGDLRYHIGKQRRFSEHQTKFLIASIVLALDYLHKNNIIHRDIKPENIVLDRRGYARLTDFGIARTLKPENSQETSGTPGYMAPEVMCRQNHGFGVDHYALGVMTYEFMMGRRPYVGKSRKEIRDNIMAKQVQIKRNEVPSLWSQDAADFINQMIQRKPQYRLGYAGSQDIQNHGWFQGFQWKQLLDKQLTSPFCVVSKSEDEDFQREISSDHDSQDQLIQENLLQLRRDSVQNLFDNYPYNVNQKETRSTNATLNIQGDRRNRSNEIQQL